MLDQLTPQIVGAEGKVKWFDATRGYGFIVGPDGQDIFVHFSVIEAGGYRLLKDGATVGYDAVRCDRGWKATRAAKVVEPGAAVPTQRTAARSPRR